MLRMLEARSKMGLTILARPQPQSLWLIHTTTVLELVSMDIENLPRRSDLENISTASRMASNSTVRELVNRTFLENNPINLKLLSLRTPSIAVAPRIPFGDPVYIELDGAYITRALLALRDLLIDQTFCACHRDVGKNKRHINFGLTSPLPSVALAVTGLVGVLTAIFIFQSASKN